MASSRTVPKAVLRWIRGKAWIRRSAPSATSTSTAHTHTRKPTRRGFPVSSGNVCTGCAGSGPAASSAVGAAASSGVGSSEPRPAR